MWISRKDYNFLMENAEKNIDAECQILRAKDNQSQKVARAMEEYSAVLEERDNLRLKVDELKNRYKQLSVCFRHKNKDGVILASCIQESMLWENMPDDSDLVYLDMEDNDIEKMIDMLHELCR